MQIVVPLRHVAAVSRESFLSRAVSAQDSRGATMRRSHAQGPPHSPGMLVELLLRWPAELQVAGTVAPPHRLARPSVFRWEVRQLVVRHRVAQVDRVPVDTCPMQSTTETVVPRCLMEDEGLVAATMSTVKDQQPRTMTCTRVVQCKDQQQLRWPVQSSSTTLRFVRAQDWAVLGESHHHRRRLPQL